MAAADHPGRRPGGRVTRAVTRLRLSLPGLWVGTVLAFLSFTPSLLPRPVTYQGLVAGLVAAVGYGLGTLVVAVVRELRDRPAGAWSRRAWRVYLVVLAVGSVVSLVAGHIWHRQSSALVGLEPTSPLLVPLTPVVALAVFAVVLLVSRALRAVARRTTSWLERRTGPRAARVLGTGVVVAATALVFSGVLLDGIVATVDRSASVGDLLTPDRVTEPTTPLRSGSPDSLIAWDDLGREGRVFVGRGPSADDIEDLTGRPAEEPIRVYAGVAAAEDERERAELAVADLERAGGLERERLLVVTTTGTGWVEPSAATSFEYLAEGDSAIVSMQYSHLPSPLSYWVDEDRARDAGRAMFDALYGRLAAMPAEDRPEVYAFGESLGSFGGEAAFSGGADMATRLDGALFVGPPRFNPLYREFLAYRDAGSPEIEPDYRDGEAIRFTLDARRPTPPTTEPWPGSHILYFQHASDPVTWWSPDLILQRPDWLEEERGPDVSDQMVWIPFVTFGQVSADLALGFATPPGTGHIFSGRHAYAWDQILGTDWPREQLDELSRLTTRR